jgi:Abortive infection alpha
MIRVRRLPRFARRQPPARGFADDAFLWTESIVECSLSRGHYKSDAGVSASVTDDEKQLIKTGADAVLAPVRDVISQIAGPFATEIGGLFGDRVRVLRFGLALKLFQKVKCLAAEGGFALNPVQLKALLPIIDAATIEENDDLHDRWSRLLAAASTKDIDTDTTALYAGLLQSLTPRDAALLDIVYAEYVERHDPDDRSMDFESTEWSGEYKALGTAAQFALILRNVIRLGLIAEHMQPEYREVEDGERGGQWPWPRRLATDLPN